MMRNRGMYYNNNCYNNNNNDDREVHHPLLFQQQQNQWCCYDYYYYYYFYYYSITNNNKQQRYSRQSTSNRQHERKRSSLSLSSHRGCWFDTVLLLLFVAFSIIIFIIEPIEAWEWDPQQQQQPCTIEQLTISEFYYRFGLRGLPSLYPKPIIILNETKTFRDKTYRTPKSTTGSNNTILQKFFIDSANFFNTKKPSVQQYDSSSIGSSSSRSSSSSSSSNQQVIMNDKDDGTYDKEDNNKEYQLWKQQLIERRTKREYFRNITKQDTIVELFGTNFEITLSSSNANSEHRRYITLEQYINEILETGETLPNQLANETWYLFGETYEPVWFNKLLKHYVLPLCHTCDNSNKNETTTTKGSSSVALSFGIGNRGSGVQWHTHGPGFSETIHGSKHWLLYPPNRYERPYNSYKDQSSRQWMEYVYMSKNATTHVHSHSKPLYQCTIDPGDILYFPTEWWHATINLDPYTVFVSSFTTEHTDPAIISIDEFLL